MTQDVFNWFVNQIKEAFNIMSGFYVLPGVNLLMFSVGILVLHTLFDLFWFNATAQYRYELNQDIKRLDKQRRNK